jgi:hypothetical protein
VFNARPEFPIEAYVGPNGSGKTYGAVLFSVIPAWEAGRPVVSNLRLYPERLGFSADLFEPLESWRQIPHMRNRYLLLDEISSVLPSRQAAGVPPDLLRRMNQLRKADVRVGWTAPNWARCDILLREVTQAVTTSRSRMPDHFVRTPGSYLMPRYPSGRIARKDNGKRQRTPPGWEPRRWFTYLTYDAIEFEEFNAAAVKGVKPKSVIHHWRPKHNVQNAYGTLEEVGLMDHLDDVGQCLACGGHRRRRNCDCQTVGAA